MAPRMVIVVGLFACAPRRPPEVPGVQRGPEVQCALVGEAPTGVLVAEGPFGARSRFPVHITSNQLTFPATEPGDYTVFGPGVSTAYLAVYDSGGGHLTCVEPVKMVELDALVRGFVTGPPTAATGPFWIEGCGLRFPGGGWDRSTGVSVERLPPGGLLAYYALNVSRGRCPLRACVQHHSVHFCGPWATADTGELGVAKVDLVLPEGLPGGVGLQSDLASTNGGLPIARVVAAGPAAGAGIVPGSRLVAVDRQPLEDGLPLREVIARIVGPVGVAVVLTIVDPQGNRLDHVLVREAILPDP